MFASSLPKLGYVLWNALLFIYGISCKLLLPQNLWFTFLANVFTSFFLWKNPSSFLHTERFGLGEKSVCLFVFLKSISFFCLGLVFDFFVLFFFLQLAFNIIVESIKGFESFHFFIHKKCGKLPYVE